MPLLTFTPQGIYCKQADVYIDPWRTVSKALITHGHSDHARRGHTQYLCVDESKPILNHRLKGMNISSIPYREIIHINGVEISFHPAGHIIGSAQIRLSHKGETWVVSGDYKVVDDGISTPFEPVQCDHFITECTFGLPVYEWKDQTQIFDSMNHWWNKNKAEGKTSLITAYSLGKAQRVIHNVDKGIGQIFTHGAVEELNKVLRTAGTFDVPTTCLSKDVNDAELAGSLIIAPSSAIGSPWLKRFKNLEIASASGWMAIRGMKRRRGNDTSFVLSDHCDWPGLMVAIEGTRATHIYPTHGYTRVFAQYLREQGYYAEPVSTEFTGEEVEEPAS